MSPPKQPDRPPRRRRRRCSACKSLDYRGDAPNYTELAFLLDDGHRHKSSLEHVIKAMRHGCQICFAVLRAIDGLIMPFLTDPPPGPIPSQTSKFPFTGYMPAGEGVIGFVQRNNQPTEITVRLNLKCNIAEDKFGIGKTHMDPTDPTRCLVGFVFEIFGHPSAPVPFEWIVPARRVAAKLTSDKRRQIVKQWMDECANCHSVCCSPNLPLPTEQSQEARMWRPRRLLDLTGNPRNMVRLIDSTEFTTQYATASLDHKLPWTSTSTLGLQTLAKFQGKIRWKDLEPAFQDAIAIASEQGIHYLWIDALCVIQDDSADVNWHIEHAHKTYGHSVLNIAMTRSDNIGQTSLGTRWLDRARTTPVGDMEIELARDGKHHKVYARSKIWDSHLVFGMHNMAPKFRCNTNPYFQRYSLGGRERCPSVSNRGSPLLDRARFMQEWILAPRTLHLHMSELVWECRGKVYCECGPQRGLDWYPPLGVWNPAKRAKDKIFLPEESRRDIWTHVMDTYVKLESRKERDRLSEIVGITACCQPFLKRAFIGGLFANSTDELAQSLLWSVRRQPSAEYRRSAPPPVLYATRAVATAGDALSAAVSVPSWSWVSVSVKRPKCRGFMHAIVEAHATLNGRLRVDKNFRVDSVESTPYPGTTGILHAYDWKLHIAGKLIVGRISTRVIGPRTYHWVAGNSKDFPPPVPPPPPAAPQTDFALVGIPSPGIAPPPLLRLEPEHLQPPPPLPPQSDGRFPAGEFTPDCNIWDTARQAAGFSGAGPSSGLAASTWAYFLLLGHVDTVGPGLNFQRTYVGLALRRAHGRQGFERVGFFTLPDDCRRLFDEGQVQEITLV